MNTNSKKVMKTNVLGIRICPSRQSALVRGPSAAIGNSGGARRTTRIPSRLFIARSNWA
jgi:hypothetical protein